MSIYAYFCRRFGVRFSFPIELKQKMKFLTRLISTFFKSEEDRKRLYKVVIPSFIIHFFAAILGLTFMFILTRSLGSGKYGVFTYSFSIVFILVTLATYGICTLVVKETPSLLTKGKTGYWKGLHKWTLKLVVVLCLSFLMLMAGFMIISTFYLHILKEKVYTIPLLLALITVPVYGIMNYYVAVLRGQQKFVLSLLPDNIIKPTIYLLCVALFYVFAIEFNLHNAILLNALAFTGAALFAMVAFYKTTLLKGIGTEYDTKVWKNALKAFFLLTAISSINARLDILMLGYLRDSSQVGVYNFADNIGSKLLIFLAIMNQLSAASISKLHTLEQKQKLQETITKISRGVFLISVPLYLFIIIFPKWIMSLGGADFTCGQTALIIISTGQIINIAYGPVGNFALMTGNQRFNIIFTSVNIIINVTLNLLLAPRWGMNGTAIATACALVSWNTCMFFAIRRKTGIRTWIFG